MEFDRPFVTSGFILLCVSATGVGADDPPKSEPDGPTAIWEYLAAKHDRDQDGKVSAAEYDRGDTAFARLDHDHDGFVTREDLELREKDDRPFTPEERQKMNDGMAPTMLLRSFATGAAKELSGADVATRFEALDADHDGKLARAELDADLKQRGLTPLGSMGMSNFDVLVRAIGADAGSALTLDELKALLARFDTDGDGAIRGGEIPEIGKVGRYVRPREDELNARAAAGVVAPDFLLSTMDGSEKVRLSSFAGDRPVALIFGSFT